MRMGLLCILPLMLICSCDKHKVDVDHAIKENAKRKGYQLKTYHIVSRNDNTTSLAVIYDADIIVNKLQNHVRDTVTFDKTGDGILVPINR